MTIALDNGLFRRGAGAMIGVEIVGRRRQNSDMRVVKATVAVVLAGLLTFGCVMALSGCGSDHTAGVVFDDGSDSEPGPTLTPPGGSAGLQSFPTPHPQP